jgi:hypothetical protein
VTTTTIASGNPHHVTPQLSGGNFVLQLCNRQTLLFSGRRSLVQQMGHQHPAHANRNFNIELCAADLNMVMPISSTMCDRPDQKTARGDACSNRKQLGNTTSNFSFQECTPEDATKLPLNGTCGPIQPINGAVNRQTSLDTLRPGKWLSGEVITCFLLTLSKRDEKAR